MTNSTIALVTGAGRGIGRAITIALGRAGHRVIGADINQDAADAISTYLQQEQLTGEGLVMDVTDPISREQALNLIRTKYGSPLILINNAGITRDNLMLRMKHDEWHAVINTNLNSIFHLTQACLRDMVKARWGRIVNITSVVGVTGNAGQANYSTAKAGLIAFGKSLAQEVASRGVTVNAIAPGFIETPMTQKLTDEQRQLILDRVPMRRIGEPTDIANAVEFLVSPKASYITGSTIHVNGGMVMI